jgi:hypothetical protein
MDGIPPKKGCQAAIIISMAAMNRLTRLAGGDKAAREAEAKEAAASLPALPEPEPIADEEVVVTASKDPSGPTTSSVRRVDIRAELEQALDPTSVYEALAPGANMPPFPARMEGSEMEVPHGIGTFKMILDYEWVTGDPYVQMVLYMNPVGYTWNCSTSPRSFAQG